MAYERPFVSVIIPTRNRKELLSANIESLFKQSYPKDRYEIIVIDNSSTDGTEEMIKSFNGNSPCILKYFRKTDEGPGIARNVGIAKASGHIMAFIDSDCVADSRWLEQGVAGMTEETGLVQGKTLPNPYQTRRTFSRTQEILDEDGIYQTCNIFYRKEAIDLAGGFSDDLIGKDRFGKPIISGEDIDLAWKVKKSGWKSAFAAGAVVYHHTFDVSPWRIIFNYRKCQNYFFALPYLLRKHPELRTHLFYYRFFIDKDRAYFDFFLLAVMLGLLLHRFFFIFAFPYTVNVLTWSFYGRPLGLYHRGLAVLVVYLLRDFVDTILLLVGSIWHRRVIL